MAISSIPFFQTHQGKKWHRTVRFRVFLGVLLFLVIQIILFVSLYFQASHANVIDFRKAGLKEKEARDGGMMVPYIYLTELKTKQRACRLRVKIVLGGNFFFKKEDISFLKEDVHITINEQKTTFLANETFIFDKRMNVPMTKGSELMYPFDTYSCQVTITGQGGGEAYLPFSSVHFDSLPLTFVTTIKTEGTNIGNIYKLETQRDAVVRVFSIFLILLLWGLSLTFFALSLQILLHKRKVDPTMLSLGLSILFATPAVRASFPLIPSTGIFIDTIGFLWNIGLIALASLFILVCYGKRHLN